ncbi:MAG: hypothetical protein LPK00_00950 [Bacillaceae bacterium]|nr:hypothetical protein [Bacillaceae bacterium]
MERVQKNEVQSGYWDRRSYMMYYRYIDLLVKGLASDAKSMIDIGSSDAEYIENFDWIDERVALDISNPYNSNKVKGIEMDFFEFHPSEKYDFLTCLQVLEHIPDAKSFAQKLFDVSDRVLLSVPYLWEAGSCAEHVHDPVDLVKLREWTGRDPDYYIIVNEALDDTPKSRRLICYYHPKGEKFILRQARKRSRTNATTDNHLEKNENNVSENINESLLPYFEDLFTKLHNRQEQFFQEFALREDLKEQKEKLESLELNNKALEKKVQNYKKEIKDISQQLKKNQQKNKFYEIQYKKIIKSRSWRITKPLRYIMDKLKARRR